MSSFLKQDYKDVKQQLQTKFNYIPNSPQEILLKRLHKCVFCVCNLQYEICKTEEQRTEFLNELHSDFIQLLVLVPLGFKKSFSLFLRAGIENALRHIYYKDHPIELALLNKSTENRLHMNDLFKYLKKHPLVENIKGFEKIYNVIHNVYEKQSRVVHGTSRRYLQLHRTIAEIKINEQELNKSIIEIEKNTNYLLTLLILFHKKQFDKIHIDHKNLILSCLSSQNKRIIHGI